MKNLSCTPYLFFEGNCREAMKFYQQIFGGELEMRTYEQGESNCPAALKDHIMHAYLSGGEIVIMASDHPGSGGLGSGAVQIALGGTDEEKSRKIFNILSKGGEIEHPLKKEVWGDLFGSFKDKYGIYWMMNITSQQS